MGARVGAGTDVDPATPTEEFVVKALENSPAEGSSQWIWRTFAVGGALLLLALVMFDSALVRARSAHPTPALMTLTSVREQLPANAWKAVPVKVPYSGTLDIEIAAEGNPLNVFVATADALQAMQNDEPTTVQPSPGFSATGTRTLRRQGVLSAGTYYVVLQDRSQSASTNSVSVRVGLRPQS